MAKVELQKWVVEKCLKENLIPFEVQDSTFKWSGSTRVKSKQTGIVYPVQVEIDVQADRKTKDQLEACLCRGTGIRVEDLQIVQMVSPRVKGRIQISGLPPKTVVTDFNKFMKQISEDPKE